MPFSPSLHAIMTTLGGRWGGGVSVVSQSWLAIALVAAEAWCLGRRRPKKAARSLLVPTGWLSGATDILQFQKRE